MPKFILTGFIKVRDVVEADDKEKAAMLFRAKYPALYDKEAKIIDIKEINENKEGLILKPSGSPYARQRNNFIKIKARRLPSS
jgi:hypothetical protein